jgi:hypothetical protein
MKKTELVHYDFKNLVKGNHYHILNGFCSTIETLWMNDSEFIGYHELSEHGGTILEFIHDEIPFFMDCELLYHFSAAHKHIRHKYQLLTK